MSTNRHYIDECTFVGESFLQQLEGMGWQVLRLNSLCAFSDANAFYRLVVM
jgi:hypothetical protein